MEDYLDLLSPDGNLTDSEVFFPFFFDWLSRSAHILWTGYRQDIYPLTSVWHINGSVIELAIILDMQF